MSRFTSQFVIFAILVVAIFSALWMTGVFTSGKETSAANGVFKCESGTGGSSSCRLPDNPYIVLVGDLALTAKSGRGMENASRLKQFLDHLYNKPPDLLVVVGGIIDSRVADKPLSHDRWAATWERYASIRHAYERIPFKELYAYGRDWESEEQLEWLNRRFSPNDGLSSWRNINFAWISQGIYWPSPDQQESTRALNRDEADRLLRQIRDLTNIVVLFHDRQGSPAVCETLPNTTNASEETQAEHPVCELIRNSQPNIEWAVNGGTGEYFGNSHNAIPASSCAFQSSQRFCVVEAVKGAPLIRQYTFFPEAIN